MQEADGDQNESRERGVSGHLTLSTDSKAASISQAK
jgi:hypothetical protein